MPLDHYKQVYKCYGIIPSVPGSFKTIKQVHRIENKAFKSVKLAVTGSCDEILYLAMPGGPRKGPAWAYAARVRPGSR